MPCVSLMTSEGENLKGKELASNGAIFVCPVSSSLSRLKGLNEFEGDFLNLDDNIEKFLNFILKISIKLVIIVEILANLIKEFLLPFKPIRL